MIRLKGITFMTEKGIAIEITPNGECLVDKKISNDEYLTSKYYATILYEQGLKELKQIMKKN